MSQDPSAPAETAYAESAAKIAAEVTAKFAAQPETPESDEVLPAPSKPAEEAPGPAAAKPADDLAARLMARLGDLEAQLAAVTAASASARQPEPERREPAEPTFSRADLLRDFAGTIQRAGVPLDYAAQSIMPGVLGDQAPFEMRARAAQQGAIATLADQLREAREGLASLGYEMKRRDYRDSVNEYVSGVKSESFPAVAAAMRSDPAYVRDALIRIATEDARVRAARDPRAAPMKPDEATKALEAELQSSARRLGLSVPTAQPAAGTAPAAPKSEPAPVPAATNLLGTPPNRPDRPLTFEEKAEAIKKDVIRRALAAGGDAN